MAAIMLIWLIFQYRYKFKSWYFFANILNSQILLSLRFKSKQKKMNENYPTGNKSHISMLFLTQQL